MVLINGIKIDKNNQLQNNNIQKKPSIKEVLDKMQNNYDNINNFNQQQVSTQTTNNNSNDTHKDNNQSDNNLLLSILPMIMSKQNASTQSTNKEQNELLRILIKNLNNPLLEKLFELLPNFTKSNKKVESKEQPKKDEPKIDSFVKTSDYGENSN